MINHNILTAKCLQTIEWYHRPWTNVYRNLCYMNNLSSTEVTANRLHEFRAWINNHIRRFYIDVAIYPCHKSKHWISQSLISVRRCPQGPLYLHGLTLIPAWISNHIPSKVWDEIPYPFLNFNGYTVEVYEWIRHFIPHFIMDVITYQCWD